MGLFKKKRCCCHQNVSRDQYEEGDIAVLGTGCKTCQTLFERVKESVETLGIKTPVKHITDIDVMTKLGILSTPALVINNQVVASGRLLSKKEIEELLHETIH